MAEHHNFVHSEESESDFEVELSDEGGSDSDAGAEHLDLDGLIAPYMYEPELGSDDDRDEGNAIPGVHNDDGDLEKRLGNSDW